MLFFQMAEICVQSIRQATLDRSFAGYNTCMSVASGCRAALSQQNLISPDSNMFYRNRHSSRQSQGYDSDVSSELLSNSSNNNNKQTEEMSQLQRRGKHTKPFAKWIPSPSAALRCVCFFLFSFFFFYISENRHGRGYFFLGVAKLQLPISLLA